MLTKKRQNIYYLVLSREVRGEADLKVNEYVSSKQQTSGN